MFQTHLSSGFNGLLLVELGNGLNLSQVEDPHPDLDVDPVKELRHRDAKVFSKDSALPGSTGDAVGQRLRDLFDQQDAKFGQGEGGGGNHLVRVSKVNLKQFLIFNGVQHQVICF